MKIDRIHAELAKSGYRLPGSPGVRGFRRELAAHPRL